MTNRHVRPASEPLSRLLGAVLGGLSGATALARGGKPLHPRGQILDAVVRRTGTSQQFGAVWLDQPGEDRGVVRLSRSIGLPAALPDVLGLALTFRSADGERHDLLLATTGLTVLTRFVLIPRRDPAVSRYSCLLPYVTDRGPVVLAATPLGARSPGRRDDPIPDGRTAADLAFGLLVAPPRGPWRQFGTLDLTARPDREIDPPLRFDPVLNPLPGLRWSPRLARLREPAYAAARRYAPTGQDTPERAVH
jgi:hypothetical protein